MAWNVVAPREEVAAAPEPVRRGGRDGRDREERRERGERGERGDRRDRSEKSSTGDSNGRERATIPALTAGQMKLNPNRVRRFNAILATTLMLIRCRLSSTKVSSVPLPASSQADYCLSRRSSSEIFVLIAAPILSLTNDTTGMCLPLPRQMRKSSGLQAIARVRAFSPATRPTACRRSALALPRDEEYRHLSMGRYEWNQVSFFSCSPFVLADFFFEKVHVQPFVRARDRGGSIGCYDVVGSITGSLSLQFSLSIHRTVFHHFISNFKRDLQ